MYTRCIFCTKPLGTNEVIETFPVGRRLAFDAERGRLWVVCRKCERWNLTPLEERWEAVEACERIFRDTRVRFSTDNIGLARHPEGLTLVRVGEAPATRSSPHGATATSSGVGGAGRCCMELPAWPWWGGPPQEAWPSVP